MGFHGERQRARGAWPLRAAAGGFVAVLALVGAQSAAADTPTGDDVVRDFGAGVTLERPTRLATVLAEPERYADEKILLRGRLTDLCTKKGCWTVLADGDDAVRVRFEDYGFFLPPDALGRHALVEGRASVRTLSQHEARHYASESRGGDPAAVVGPQREVGFVASGVRLVSTQE